MIRNLQPFSGRHEVVTTVLALKICVMNFRPPDCSPGTYRRPLDNELG